MRELANTLIEVGEIMSELRGELDGQKYLLEQSEIKLKKLEEENKKLRNEQKTVLSKNSDISALLIDVHAYFNKSGNKSKLSKKVLECIDKHNLLKFDCDDLKHLDFADYIYAMAK